MIPSTGIVTLDDINRNLNRALGSSCNFNTHVSQFDTTSPFDLTTCRQLVRSSGYYGLLKFDRTNGSTAVDDYAKTFALSSLGSATISTAQSKFGGSSLLTNNTDTSFTLPVTPTNLALGSYAGDWTIEMFVYYISGGAGVSRFMSNFAGTVDSSIRFNGVSLHCYYFEPPSSTFRSIEVSLGSRPTNTWFHVAFVRQGTTLSMYYNGNRLGTTAITGSALTMNTFRLGQSGTEFFNGYIDEVRFSNFARYTAATYTVPTASFDA